MVLNVNDESEAVRNELSNSVDVSGTRVTRMVRGPSKRRHHNFSQQVFGCLSVDVELFSKCICPVVSSQHSGPLAK